MKQMTKEQKFLAASGQLGGASEVLSAGYAARALLSAGYAARALLSAGYAARALLSAGYTARALLSAGRWDVDLPEPRIADDCPLHGRGGDPDAERDRLRDEAI